MHADHFSWFNTGDLSVNGCHNNNHIAPLNTTLRWSLRDVSNLSIRGRGHCPSSLTVANGCRHSWQVKPFTMAAWWWPSLGDWLFDSILPLSPQLCRIETWQGTRRKITRGPWTLLLYPLLVMGRSAKCRQSNYQSHWDLSLHVFISPAGLPLIPMIRQIKVSRWTKERSMHCKD